MTDRFTEYMVTKIPTAQDKAKKGLLIGGAVVLTGILLVLAYITGWYFILVLAIAAFYGAYYLISGMGVEYEYTFTNGVLDIDKIMGKRKRIEMISVETAKFEDFGEVTADLPDKPNATLILCSDNTDVGEYYADLTTEEYGETRIIFTPSEKMAAYIEEALPRTLKFRKEHQR